MNFVHDFVPVPEGVTEEMVDGKRFYKTPEGVKYKSVTTIIGEASDKSWIRGWRDRVGDDEADQILFQAQGRGSAVHELAEKYVMKDPNWVKGAMPVNVSTFKKIKRELDASLTKVYGIEYPLWSDMLRTAGRTDLPGQWEGVNTIVDFKNTRSAKTAEDIPGYFVQVTAYAVMFEERTGIKMPQGVILVADDSTNRATVFKFRCRDWYPEVARIFMGKSAGDPTQAG